MDKIDQNGILSVINGITEGIARGLEKRREYQLQERKMAAEEAQSRMYQAKNALDERRLDLMEQASGLKAKESMAKAGESMADVALKKEQGINLIQDNIAKNMDQYTKVTSELSALESRYDPNDEQSVQMYGQRIKSLQDVQQRLGAGLGDLQDRLYRQSGGQMGIPKTPPPPLTKEAKAVGGKPLGTINVPLEDFIDNARNLADKPGVNDATLLEYFRKYDTTNLSPADQQRFKEAAQVLIGRAKANSAPPAPSVDLLKYAPKKREMGPK